MTGTLSFLPTKQILALAHNLGWSSKDTPLMTVDEIHRRMGWRSVVGLLFKKSTWQMFKDAETLFLRIGISANLGDALSIMLMASVPITLVSSYVAANLISVAPMVQVGMAVLVVLAACTAFFGVGFGYVRERLVYVLAVAQFDGLKHKTLKALLESMEFADDDKTCVLLHRLMSVVLADQCAQEQEEHLRQHGRPSGAALIAQQTLPNTHLDSNDVAVLAHTVEPPPATVYKHIDIG